MKIKFNDATEITVLQVSTYGDYLNVKTVGNTPEQLRVLFEDTKKTSHMVVEERGSVIGTYDGYTVFYRTEEYTGKIYGITMYKEGKTPEEIEKEMQNAIAYNAEQITDLQLAVCELYEGQVNR